MTLAFGLGILVQTLHVTRCCVLAGRGEGHVQDAQCSVLSIDVRVLLPQLRAANGPAVRPSLGV